MTDTGVFSKKENIPTESYSFTYSYEEYNAACKSNLHAFVVRTAVLGIAFVAITAGVVMSDMTNFFGGFLAGWTLMYFVISLIGLLGTRKNWKIAEAKICSSVYKYEVFSDHLLLTVTRDGESVYFTKLEYDKLRRKIDAGSLYILDFANQTYMVKKQEIADNSIFHTLKPKPPEKPSAPLRRLSKAMLVLSIVSGVSGFVCASIQLFSDGTIKWWYLLAFGSIPLISFIFGIYMKKYGGGRGNVIAGLFVLAILCILFCARPINEPEKAEEYAQIEVVESYIGVPLPKHYSYDNFEGIVNGIDYENTAMWFHSEEADFIEGIIVDSEKWSTVLTHEISELVSKVGITESWDFVSVYNIISDEYNKVPEDEGTYSMAAMYYNMDSNGLYVIEYEYVK